MNVAPQLFALGFKRAQRRSMTFYRKNIKVAHKRKGEPPHRPVWVFRDSMTKEYSEFSCFRNLLTYITSRLLEE